MELKIKEGNGEEHSELFFFNKHSELRIIEIKEGLYIHIWLITIKDIKSV